MTSYTMPSIHRLTYGLLSLSIALLASCSGAPPPTPTAVASVVEILSSPKYGQVKVREAIIRAAADETSEELARLPFGAIMLIVAHQDEWVQIESPSPRKVTGWTLADFLDVAIQTPIGTAVLEPTATLINETGALGTITPELPIATETSTETPTPTVAVLEPPTPTNTPIFGPLTATPISDLSPNTPTALPLEETALPRSTILEPPKPTGTPTLLLPPAPTETAPFEPITPTVALNMGGAASGTTLLESPTPTETSTGTPTATPMLLEPPTPTETAFLVPETPVYEPPTPTETPSDTPTPVETPRPTNTAEPPEPEEPPDN